MNITVLGGLIRFLNLILGIAVIDQNYDGSAQ